MCQNGTVNSSRAQFHLTLMINYLKLLLKALNVELVIFP